jgi:hypothetical protein
MGTIMPMSQTTACMPLSLLNDEGYLAFCESDFASRKWVGFDGTIIGNPSLDICRTQIDVRIHGDSTALLEEMKSVF